MTDSFELNLVADTDGDSKATKKSKSSPRRHQKRFAKGTKKSASSPFDSDGLRQTRSAPRVGLPSKERPGGKQQVRSLSGVLPMKDESAGGASQFVSSLFSSNPEVQRPSMASRNTIELSSEPGINVSDSTNALPSLDATSFSSLGLGPALCNHLSSRMSITIPTRIQSSVIQEALKTPPSDIIVKAQTGSGKTLAYLLPIVQMLITAQNDFTGLSRKTGTLAFIISPTRELAKQIFDVLEVLLKYRRVESVSGVTDADHSSNNPSVPRAQHWMVPGLVVGGDKKKSEKARLRKGCTILVATPGRLLDHLKTTKSFEVGNLRWVVLDEADRLLELGFESTLKEIINIIDKRRSTCIGDNCRINTRRLPRSRQTILTSATLQNGIKKLAETSLVDPLYVDGDSEGGISKFKAIADNSDEIVREDNVSEFQVPNEVQYSAPSQLLQIYSVIPSKLRLVALTAVLRQLQSRTPFKGIVFVDTCDTVDFLSLLYSDCFSAQRKNDKGFEDSEEDSQPATTKKSEISAASVVGTPCGKTNPILFHSSVILKLHGNMPQQARAMTFKTFVEAENAILICTDVAARGLDLPDITDVIQYDLPLDVRDYVHRIGRTARLGRSGRAISFLLPSEIAYIELLSSNGMKLEETDMLGFLKSLMGIKFPNGTVKSTSDRKKRTVEDAATDLQMLFERFILMDTKNLDLARAAFRSHIRAYSTHPAANRDIFHIKNLHLGHVAKSFALRDAPSAVSGANGNSVISAHVAAKRDRISSEAGRRGGIEGTKTDKRKRLFVSPAAEFESGVAVKKSKSNHGTSEVV